VAHIRVLNHYLHTKFIFLGALEFLLLGSSLLSAVDLRNYFSETHLILENPLAQVLVFALVMNCCSLAMGVYTSVFREGKTGMILRTIVSYCFLGMVSLTVLYYFIPGLYMGRGILAYAVAISLVSVLLLRFAFYFVVDLAQLGRNVVILGSGQTALQILERLNALDDRKSFNVLGCIPCGSEERFVGAELLLQAPYDWPRFVKENDVTEIVVAPDERRRSEGGDIPVDELLNCKLAGVSVKEPLEFIERELLRVEISMLRPGWALYSNGFTYSQTRDILKRVFDLSVAGLLLFLMWPFMLLTALAVALETGFPVLYKQTRTGYNGKDFSIYKFRSMTKDAEKGGKAVWAQKNDARVTRVGAFIRNTRLDELPQLWNVIRGDMSFVGPRPERPEFVKELKEQIPFYDARHKVKPGLMGWAQLKYPYGASVEDARNKLKYDLYYVKNHSFFMDVLIVIQTVEVVLLGKGVH
jgi:sugar transferase (PEP-CTERM system associated)